MNKELNEVKKEVRELGYRLKTYRNSLGRFAGIFDNENIFILGSSISVYTKDDMKKHYKIFEWYFRFKGYDYIIKDKNEIVYL